jgi:hypothetical protein
MRSTAGRRWWPVTVGLMMLAGCWGGSRPETPTGGTGSPKETAVPVKPLLEGWEPPAVALLLSGETHGYLEPCGCSETQSGGLARRAHLERILTGEKQWTVVGLDAGDTLKRSRRQDQIKFEAILSGLKQLGYEGVAAGQAELRLDPALLLSQFTAADGVPLGWMLLGGNVVLYDTPDLGVPQPYRVIEANGVKIGVIAVTGKSVADEVAPAGVSSNVAVKEAQAAVDELLPKLQAETPDLLVLISSGSLDEARALAKANPQFHAVLAAGGPEEPASQPERIGDTLLLLTGHKGKHVGVLGYYPDATPKLKWELVNLDNQRFDSDPRMEQLMRHYQQQLQDLDLARSDELLTRHASGLTYVGAAKCGECHTKAYSYWKETPHAKAYDSLSRGRKGQEANWVSRIHDPECLACHVTGWNPQEVLRYDSGFLDAVQSKHLVGQQCENCHGPGSQHTNLEWQYRKDRQNVSLDDVNAARAAVKLNSATAEKQVCTKCHDLENSPNFNFAKYWDKVKHPWKD